MCVHATQPHRPGRPLTKHPSSLVPALEPSVDPKGTVWEEGGLPWTFPLVGVMRGAKPSIRCLTSMLGSWRPVLWWGYATTTPCRSSPPSSSLNPSSQRQQRRLPRRDMCMVAAPELAPSSQSRRTLQRCLEFHGTGLHSGTKVRNPSPPKGWALGIGA